VESRAASAPKQVRIQAQIPNYNKQAHRNAGSRAKQQEAYATISETKCNKRYNKLTATNTDSRATKRTETSTDTSANTKPTINKLTAMRVRGQNNKKHTQQSAKRNATNDITSSLKQ